MKTIQLSNLAAKVLAADVNSTRLKSLAHNKKKYALSNTEVKRTDVRNVKEKFDKVKEAIAFARPSELKPLPVKQIAGCLVLTDGHTRALAAFFAGFRRLKVKWDTDDEDWRAYEVCVQWCKQENIVLIADLAPRIVSERAW